MTTTATAKHPQIFLSFAAGDHAFAESVATELRSGGADVLSMNDVAAAGDYSEGVRRALQRSGAVVVALNEVSDRRDIPASILFEIGMAVGAGKPIFVILSNPSSILPFNAPHLQVFPPNRLQEIPRLIRKMRAG